jgi:hypothetical protein
MGRRRRGFEASRWACWGRVNMFPSVEDQVINHYRQFLGESVKATHLAIADPPGPFSILEYKRGGDDLSWWTYATAGLCRHSMPPVKGGNQDTYERRIELMMYADEQTSDIEGVLAGLGTYPFEYGTHFSYGDRISGVEGIVAGSPLTDFIFMPALAEVQEFGTLHIDGQAHVDILWALPIYATERLFANQHGWRALVELFADAKVSSTDFFRKAAA